MSLAIDLILLAVIAMCVVGGIKRGFIRTLMSFVTVIAAALGAWYFTPSLSLYIRSTFLEDKITDPVTQIIRSLLSPSLDGKEALPRLFSDMPDAFSSLLSRYGADASAAQNTVGSSAPDTASALASFLAQPAVEMISDALAFILLFFGIALALTIVTLVLDMIFKLPVLNALNRVGGLALGMLVGALYAWVIAAVLAAVMPYLAQVLPNLFNQNTLSDTFLAGWFAQYNPLSMLDIKLFGV